MAVFEAERPRSSIVYKSRRGTSVEILREQVDQTEVPDKVRYVAAKYGSSALERITARGGTWTFHSQEDFEETGYSGLYLVPMLEERIIYPDATMIYAIEENGRVTEAYSKSSDPDYIELALESANMVKFHRKDLVPFGLEAKVTLEARENRMASPVLRFTRLVPSNPRSFVDHEFPYFPRIGEI